MSPIKHSLLVLLSVCLPVMANAAPVQFTNYGDFYRSLGGNLFQGPGTALAMPCAEAPRNCIWVTSMGQAIRRYDQTQWTTPDGLAMKPQKGIPDVAFDGQALIVGKQRWPLSGVTNLAPPEWNGGAPIDPENLEDVTVWQHGTSVCLDMRYVSSGKGDRYTEVLLLHRQRLYTLPPLFGTCAAIHEAPQNQFSYPNNTYQGPEQENNPSGLQVDYLLSDGKTRVARYLLRFPNQGDPFLFEAVRQ
ncbi:hypothetical protein M5C90_11985 [Pseudomonas chlororaphis subsp. piscium]|nr:hypothetical protein M5C90_11985 [Pseudomonas chlororaphis subsp. piscium]